MTAPSRQDRVIRWITIASAALAALTLAAAATALPILIDTRSGIEAQRRSDAITSCRSETRADLDLAKAAVEDIVLDGLAAALTGDTGEIEEVLAHAAAVRAERDAAVDAVREAADLSATDPDGFLDRCRSG